MLGADAKLDVGAAALEDVLDEALGVVEVDRLVEGLAPAAAADAGEGPDDYLALVR